MPMITKTADGSIGISTTSASTKTTRPVIRPGATKTRATGPLFSTITPVAPKNSLGPAPATTSAIPDVWQTDTSGGAAGGAGAGGGMEDEFGPPGPVAAPPAAGNAIAPALVAGLVGYKVGGLVGAGIGAAIGWFFGKK